MKSQISRLGITVLLLIVAVVTVMAYIQVYVVHDAASAILFSRGDEAYLFLGSSHTGYRFTYLRYLLEGIKEYFHVVAEPNDQSTAGTVVHITPAAVERHLMEFGNKSLTVTAFLTPFDDGFYALCSGAVYCKWNGDGFRPATVEEERSHGGIEKLYRGSVDKQTINEWQAREILPGNHFEVNVNNKFSISANSHSFVHESINIDLVRVGQEAPQTLYSATDAPRTVSKEQYRQYFPIGQ